MRLIATSLLAGLILFLTGTGCATNPLTLSPRVVEALYDGGFPHAVHSLRADVVWSTAYGQGLTITVRVLRAPEDYSRDIDLEIEGAAEVLAALDDSPLATRWGWVEVFFFNDFGKLPPRNREVVGLAQVLMHSETIVLLRDQGAGASDYPSHWLFLSGLKVQPDSEVLLEWPEEGR